MLLFDGLWKVKVDYVVSEDKHNIFYFSRGWRAPPSSPWFNSYNLKKVWVVFKSLGLENSFWNMNTVVFDYSLMIKDGMKKEANLYDPAL